MPSRGQQPDPSETRHAGSPSATKTRPPECYPSNAADAPIVHAATGEPLGSKVGSADSLALFRVTDTTGLYMENGHRATAAKAKEDDTVGKTPNQFYYRTPSEFETHWGAPPPTSAVSNWTARVDRLFPEGTLKADAWEGYVSEDPQRLRGRGNQSIGQAC